MTMLTELLSSHIEIYFIAIVQEPIDSNELDSGCKVVQEN